ncbi:MAG TPA: 50S ribosomal protein L32 [Spirochaetia bacterium]|jgi:large subunit ribosomal protein L32|nr:50S ribosomal protein L32 [Spirochaetia bacterium]
MAVPKFNTSKTRTRRRRSANMKMTVPNLMACGNCGNKILMHRVCPKCGFYRGKQVFEPESMA